MGAGLAAVRFYLTVEAGAFPYFTAELVKTLVHTVARDIGLFRGVKGVVSPLHVSPLFRPGRGDFELGELYTATINAYNGSEELVPVELSGQEFIAHVGGDAALVSRVAKGLGGLRGPLYIKYKDYIVGFRVEKVGDVTGEIGSKVLGGDAERVTLYLKGPVIPFNVLAPSRLPKFSPSAYEVLFTAYLLHAGERTATERHVLASMRLLGRLVETYYSLSTIRPLLIPYKGRREPALVGKITYIVDTEDKHQRQAINEVLNTAEIAGTGRSRANGFGTTTWRQK